MKKPSVVFLQQEQHRDAEIQKRKSEQKPKQKERHYRAFCVAKSALFGG
jgi:hypothetical protein